MSLNITLRKKVYFLHSLLPSGLGLLVLEGVLHRPLYEYLFLKAVLIALVELSTSHAFTLNNRKIK